MSEKTQMYSPGEEACSQHRRVGMPFLYKTGHFKKDCRKFLASQKFKQDAKTAATLEKQESDGEVFVTSQAFITVSKGNCMDC